jgi:hypothetical protein
LAKLEAKFNKIPLNQTDIAALRAFTGTTFSTKMSKDIQAQYKMHTFPSTDQKPSSEQTPQVNLKLRKVALREGIITKFER